MKHHAVVGAKLASAESWRSRLIRTLLYGRNVDRSAKARTRVGFAIIAFAAVYLIIGGRLVFFAINGDSHGTRRTASQDAIATARPDIVDRNGEILATDVKTPSLFGEPRRIIDKDEAIELLTATLPDLDAGEVRDRLSSRKGFVLVDDAAGLAEQRRRLYVGCKNFAVAIDDIRPRGCDGILRRRSARAVTVAIDGEEHQSATNDEVHSRKCDDRKADAGARLGGAIDIAPVQQRADQTAAPRFRWPAG